MILYIDTTDFNNATFALAGGRTIKKQACGIDPHESHGTLAILDKFLHRSKVPNPRAKITEIVVNSGPGSYTGTRIGITIAQALGFAWGVPVKAVPKDKFIIR
jgi:tRNA threonylcarbamoyladenosine biosynthesis protein TsaB